MWKNRTVWAIFTRWKLARLARHPNPAARAVAQALTDVIEDRFSPDERQVIEHIEALRATLSASEERLSFYYEGGSVKEKTVGEICRGAAQPRRWALLRTSKPSA